MEKTNEEKKKLIDEACELCREAMEKLNKAEDLFNKCDIELCGGFDYEPIMDRDKSERNILIYSGGKNLHLATETEPYFMGSCGKGRLEEKRRFTDYAGIRFTELADEIESKFIFR